MAYGYAGHMPTRIRQKGTRPHLYIAEWMAKLDLSDERLGERMDVARQTIYRWRTEQNRLNPGKIAALAVAMGRHAEDLYRPPERPSVDAMLKTATPDQIADTIAFVERFVLKN